MSSWNLIHRRNLYQKKKTINSTDNPAPIAIQDVAFREVASLRNWADWAAKLFDLLYNSEIEESMVEYLIAGNRKACKYFKYFLIFVFNQNILNNYRPLRLLFEARHQCSEPLFSVHHEVPYSRQRDCVDLDYQ